MSGVNEIRSSFLDYFARNGHEVVPSSPLVPRNDPTLMFTNAGMVQFKNVFTGLEKRPYTRAVTAQKCVRAGGKHNDLDNVGYTARHHTFFEMLGNFSFGDYFKDRAIELAWNLVTKEFGLPADRLMVTVFIDDDQAFDLWKKIAGLPESKIVRIAGSDNFWQMGDLGPCGPCSEIFYDHGPQIPGGPPGSPDAEGDRFIEIWNLVFMQFEQLAGGKRVDLPRPSIDTGMGLERIAAVLQGTHDNYKIDLFGAIISHVADLTGVEPEGARGVSHRVIADHLRASAFLIADGVLPSNEGRGYVLRRIMRRAMRHAQLLGADEPLMWRLVPTLIREMGQAYPELAARRGADRRDAQARGDALPQDARARACHPRRGDPRAHARRPAQGRDRLHALRHLRLSARSDPGRAQAARHRASTPKASTRPWSASARRRARRGQARATRRPKRCGSPCARTSAPPSSSATRPRRAEGVVAALVKDGKEVAALQAGRERRRRPQPDAVLWRSRAARSATPASCTATACAFASPTPRRRRATCSSIPAKVEKGTLEVGAALTLEVDHAPAKRHPAKSFGDPPAARGAAPGARRSRRAEGLAGRARPAALRLLPSQADDGGGDRAGRGHRQRCRAAELAGDHAADGGRRRDRVRRARAVRREIRRRGAGRRHGRGRRQHHGLVGRALRRHPCRGAPATSA